MKVLQINVCVNTSSTGKITEEIGKLLIENGHESYIAYGRTNRGSVSQLIKIGNRFDVLMHVMRTRVFDRHGFASTLATKKLIKQIRKIQPDVICLHNLHGYYINIDILFKFLKTAEIPVVWTLFDVWAFTGHCSYFEIPGGKDCLKWKNECNHCIKKSKYPSSFFKDNSQQNFLDKKALYSELPNLQIVVHSKWLQILVQQSILQNSKTHLINSGIDADVFKPVAVSKVIEKYNLFGYKIILGVANIWDRRKGLNDFVTLSKSLDYYEKIVLVGITKHQKKILPKNIVAIEQTESIEELCEIYSMADVFVNPTFSDNFPTTNLEALACGTPVITYNTGGSPEAINENTGIIVERGNIAALKKAIEDILCNTEMNYSDACRKRALQFFNAKLQYRKYLNLFCELDSLKK